MTGYKIVNLKILVEEAGEDFAKQILSSFSCPLNQDVEVFLKLKAIEFAKQGLSQTHLVFTSYKQENVLVGYFTLASKYITVKGSKKMSNTLKKRIRKFSVYDSRLKSYCLSAPLIAQVGKNYAENYDSLITGDELLALACNKVAKIQLDLGGRFAYLECEDKPALLDFYEQNGFCAFDYRSLDPDETGLDGEYLVQLLKYIKDGQ
jgi:hypothetical protein